MPNIMTKEKYQSLPVKTLREIAKARGLRGMSTQKKAAIIEAMLALDAREAGAESSAEAGSDTVLSPDVQETAPRSGTQAEEVPERTTEDRADLSAGMEAAGTGAFQSDRESVEKCTAEDDSSAAENGLSAAADDGGDISPAAPVRSDPAEANPSRNAPGSGAIRNDADASSQMPQGTGTANEKREDRRDKSVYVPGAIPGDQGNTVRGLLEVMTDGFGFLRSANFLPGEEDVYVSPSQIRRFNLRTGDMVEGNKREKAQNEKYGALIYVSRVNDRPADEARRRFTFENMTPIFPNRRIRLERPDGSRATRIVDLISPIGKGQRGMIVSPPKAGKTTLLKDIAKSILTGDPDSYLIILLIDERPEEVTDMKESVRGRHVEILYSTFDETPEHHKRVSEMVIERAKRLVEQKEDVIILLDSITRLARAYNILVPPSGRTLSGGLDPTALYMPKRFFGAARNMREGGSLTILATALVDTGSKMDDVVYEEFKGTGNMELILDRKLQERRMFPAIDIVKSGTRREDLLLTPKERRAVDIMRRRMNGLKAEDAVETILDEFTRLPTNDMVVDQILAKWK